MKIGFEVFTYVLSNSKIVLNHFVTRSVSLVRDEDRTCMRPLGNIGTNYTDRGLCNYCSKF